MIPGAGLARLGSLLEISANLSPRGSHEKSVTVSNQTLRIRQISETRRRQTFQFDNFYREVLLANTEDLEITEDRLLRFGVAIDLDAKEITLVLPVKLALNTVMSKTARWQALQALPP